MRQLACGVLLLLAISGHAADTAGYQQWLEFKQAFAEEVGGPTGIYAIQHMIELDAGETAYLPAGKADDLRWLKVQPGAAIASVNFSDKRALLSGPGIERRDLLQSKDNAFALANGLTVRTTLLREKILKVWLYNAQLPARKNFKGLEFFPYDPRGRITGAFQRKQQPVAVSYIDSREQAGTMYEVGRLEVEIEGRKYDLKTFSYRKDWSEIDALLLLLRDRTSGKTTYGGGRVVDIRIPRGNPPPTITFDLNTAYSFLCAHSEYFNCPLVLTNRVDAELPFGEKHSPTSGT
jgi:uncharacterized protein